MYLYPYILHVLLPSLRVRLHAADVPLPPPPPPSFRVKGVPAKTTVLETNLLQHSKDRVQRTLVGHG